MLLATQFIVKLVAIDSALKHVLIFLLTSSVKANDALARDWVILSVLFSRVQRPFCVVCAVKGFEVLNQ